jgi:prolyl 4-hydroxylase
MLLARRALDDRDQVSVIDNFLSTSECAKLITASEQRGYEEALITGHNGVQRMAKHIRNNDRVIWDDGALAEHWWQRAREHLPSAISGWKACGFNERFRFCRYTPGQRFAPHRDGSFERNPNEVSWLTFMVYLNDQFEGGCTRFDLANLPEPLMVKPLRGQALIFVHNCLHEGQSVETGCKYVLRTDVMFKRELVMTP